MSWQDKLNQLGSAEEQQLLRRLRQEDRDLADAMWAKMVESRLDEIGVEKASDPLHQKLYAIADGKPAALKRWRNWGVWAGVAAVLVLAVLINPWKTTEPSAEEIAQARQQLAVTFYYLDKAADVARQETEASIAMGVKTAMDSSPFLEMELEAEEDNGI